MLTENRKRPRSGEDVENGHLLPQAKRQSRGHPVSPEPGRDAWDSESSNSETSSSSSSSISSPEHLAANSSSRCPCSPLNSTETSDLGRPSNLVSYQRINRILKEAHFQSLQCRGQHRDTCQSGPSNPWSALVPVYRIQLILRRVDSMNKHGCQHLSNNPFMTMGVSLWPGCVWTS